MLGEIKPKIVKEKVSLTTPQSIQLNPEVQTNFLKSLELTDTFTRLSNNNQEILLATSNEAIKPFGLASDEVISTQKELLTAIAHNDANTIAKLNKKLKEIDSPRLMLPVKVEEEYKNLLSKIIIQFGNTAKDLQKAMNQGDENGVRSLMFQQAQLTTMHNFISSFLKDRP